jgi:hypothetical protein
MITQKVQTVYFAGTDNLELSTLPNIGNVDKIYTIDSNGNYLGWLSDLVNYDYLQAFDHFYMGVYYIIYTKDGVGLPYDLFGFNNEPVYQTEFMAVSGQKQDIYRFDITNNSNSAYVFNGVGLDTDEENPSIHLQRGNTYLFDVDAFNHPFWITDSADPNQTAQTVAYIDGVTNNGSGDGRIKFDVPHDAPGTLYYRCNSHVAMSGTIYTDDGLSETSNDLSNLILDLQVIDGGEA